MSLSKKKSQLQLRLEERARRHAIAKAALVHVKKEQKSNRDDSRKRRKSAKELAKYIAYPLSDSHVLRDPDAFTTRTYDLARQVEELVSYLFVRYPVPGFLKHVMLSPEGRMLVMQQSRSEAYRKQKRRQIQWETEIFLAAAQGKSVAKILAPELNRRECHWFMLAPETLTFHQAMIWARFMAAGIAAYVAERLAQRLGFGDMLEKLGNRRNEFIQFFASVPKSIGREVLAGMVDFSMAMIDEPTFRFKGRTVSSMQKLAREWHRFSYYGPLGERRVWKRTFTPWEHKTPLAWVRVFEMHSNWELHAESVRQRHCVFTYASECEQGLYQMLSMQWGEDSPEGDFQVVRRITIEVSQPRREVTQALGKYNRKLTSDERAMIRHWAELHGVAISPHVWW